MKMKSLGFTLIEIMVVIVIVSILVGAVSLTFPRSTDDLLKEDAERFSELLYLAQDEAILQSRDLAIAINDSGYSFLSKNDKSWSEFSEEPFKPKKLSGNPISALDLEGINIKLTNKSKTKPQIVIYSSGEITPFVYSFGYKNASYVSIDVDAGGTIKKDYKFEDKK